MNQKGIGSSSFLSYMSSGMKQFEEKSRSKVGRELRSWNSSITLISRGELALSERSKSRNQIFSTWGILVAETVKKLPE